MSTMLSKHLKRSVDAFVSYIADQLQDPITKAQSHEDLDNLEVVCSLFVMCQDGLWAFFYHLCLNCFQ